MPLTLNGTTGIAGANGSASTPAVQGEDTNTGVFFPAADTVAVATGGSERMRVTSAGNVGIGTTAPAVALDIFSSGSTYQKIQRGTTGHLLIGAEASSNSIYSRGATDATDFPLRFLTASNERMRITDAGALLVAKTATGASTVGIEANASGLFRATRSGGECIEINRLASDGDLVIFRQAGNTEGSISVSGTTVSYNGGHLSRWAQFPDNSRPELLKGTVMSNLDQMSNWDQEDNEQLNCVQVSAVEGDANVAGVFVAWDSTDDGYNDILLAMTGDMVIRIAGGTTVQRGDLLMSAGDGTAKPQGDDIVRSKTIAKVTSTHISHTYADGSYAVPCVLMAC